MVYHIAGGYPDGIVIGCKCILHPLSPLGEIIPVFLLALLRF